MSRIVLPDGSVHGVDDNIMSEEKTEVSPAEVARTTRTANIRMLTDTIEVYINEHGRETPLLIVARCELDDREYAALFNLGDGMTDPARGKCYAVEVVRENGQIKRFRDLDGLGQDEEWAVISNYFLDNNVYERNRIINWIMNTRTAPALVGGVPQKMADRWEKKRMKRRTT